MSVGDDRVIFVIYRQADTLYAVEKPFSALDGALDIEVLKGADKFGVRISIVDEVERILQRASLLALVIGPKGFKLSEGWSIVPIFRNDDWVRHEICTAVDGEIPIIPIYVGGAARLRAEVLPPKVRQIADFAPGRRASRLPNDDVIRTEKSNSDIDAFVEALSRGFCQLKRFNGEWDSLVII